MSSAEMLVTRTAGSREGWRDGNESLKASRAIRTAVFIEEQGIPSDLEWDGLDATSEHFIVFSGRGSSRAALGTARLRIETGRARAQRVAVLPSARGLGLGRRLMEALEARARALGIQEMELHAQTSVVEFYLALDYQAEGTHFLEAGIEHVAMRKRLA